MEGLKVRAFVRDQSKIPDDVAGSVEPFLGDVLDPVKVTSALQGQDAVVVALGTRNDLNIPEGQASGEYQIEESKVPVRNVSKHDLGEFLVKAATSENEAYRGKTMGIGTLGLTR
ncbi:unnamed protein product [Notodromas monacha]|uniref:NAD(P)-binding domain-containing protein n=1 Tax=Notodromas monacha TaxID=399045 RepID=A0A7R9BZ08_9CRUS|nr:unnamed protein product [Notodromas monacha]CAG0923961.1 unnamed protein product [Notodromas monacha]